MGFKKIVQLLSLSVASLMSQQSVTFLSPSNVSGATLTTGMYVLTDNATVSSSISITGTNVVFDLNGKTLSVIDNANGINVEASNVVIQNGFLFAPDTTGNQGILISNSGSTPTGVFVHEVSFDGFANGLCVKGATDVQIKNCEAYGCLYGFYFTSNMSESCSGRICNCVANYGVNTGFYIDFNSEMVVQNCQAYNNSEYGFVSNALYTDSIFLGNIAGLNGTNYAGDGVPPYYPISNGTAQTTSTIPPIDHTLVNYSIT